MLHGGMGGDGRSSGYCVRAAGLDVGWEGEVGGEREIFKRGSARL
jgi:hypothetical protein